MRITPIYIKSLRMSGVKTFKRETELKMYRPTGEISNWTLILGENGIGKSTLLQCIAWMKPALPYDISDTNDLKPAPLINDEENETLERLVSKSKDNILSAKIQGNFVANQKLNSNESKSPVTCETSMTIGLNNFRKLDLVDPNVSEEHKDVFYKDEVLVYGYSAMRKLGKQNLADTSLFDTIPNFINESTELYDAEEILHSINYAKLGSSSKKKRDKYDKVINDIINILVDCLPHIETMGDIEIHPPKVLLNDPEGGITITTKHGTKIPFKDFSLGYRTVISLIIDLTWRIFNKYHNDSKDPLKEPAIVLIDEIDLHLHPKWQRDIMQNLTKHFPNVQFIATAHSPLMVQAALDYNYAVVSFDSDEDTLMVNNSPDDLDGWRVDQILTSDLFGLVSARGKKYDDLILKRTSILNKRRLLKKDKELLAEIEKQLQDLPTGEDEEQMKVRGQISELYDKIINGTIEIDL